MSYTYLREEGEEFSAEYFSDIPASVLSKLNLTDEKSCSNDNVMESFQDSQSGMTLIPSTENRGAEESMPSAVGFPAKTLASLDQVLESPEHAADYGNKWRESFANLNQKTCLWKTPQLSLFEDSEPFSLIFPEWGMMQNGECFPVEKWVGCICENASLFSLPTIGKNEFKGASRKRFRGSRHFRGAKMSEGLRICESDDQYTHPVFAEEVMGWPITWTASQPLEMARFQEWLRLHGEPFRKCDL